MHRLARYLAIVVCTIVLAVPFSVAALTPMVPVGGKVVSIIPCLHVPGYLYVVAGFGIGSGVFWYVPGTITYLFGPPIIGRWVLGLAAPVGACGLTTTFVGSSAAI